MKKWTVIVVSILLLIAIIVSAAWYGGERGKVVALGQEPSGAFCHVASWLGYYDFNPQERAQCEHIIHPKPVDPSL